MQKQNKIFFLGLMVFFTACSSLKRREDLAKEKYQHTEPMVAEGNANNAIVEAAPLEMPIENEGPSTEPTSGNQPSPSFKAPKIGLIFGPGGAKTFAQVGFLQEVQKMKIPIHAVSGIEWGAIVAGLYALKGSANDVDWQMSKIKGEDVFKKGLIGSSSEPNDFKAMDEFLKLAFSRFPVENAKIPFSCPAFNVNKNQIYVMNRGPFENLLPYCVSYPPLFRPWKGNVAAVKEVSMMADQLRRDGANVIIFVNVLGSPDLDGIAGAGASVSDSVHWSELASQYQKKIPGVHYVISLSSAGYDIKSFEQKNDIVRKGSASASKQLSIIAKQLAL